jgi:hypothetical protein
MWLCVIIGRNGAIPKVTEITKLPVGAKYLLLLPVGLHFEAMELRAPELAAALGAREVLLRPVRSNAQLVELIEVREHPFPEMLRSDLSEVKSTSFD